VELLLPKSVEQVIITGSQSGSLSDSLISISDTFNEKAETSAKNLTVILEPVLLVIVWLGVVGIALAVILPLYKLIGSLNG
jgi:type IV pilus assembly protein PilC